MLDLQKIETQPEPLCVARLRDTYWQDARGELHYRRSLRTMRRLSTGYYWLEEDATQIGAQEVIQRIVNLQECSPGLYIVVPCNMRSDWETGLVDSYDYKLVPYEPGDTRAAGALSALEGK